MRTLCIIILTIFSLHLNGQTVNDLRPTVTMKEYVDMQAEWQEKINSVRFENLTNNVVTANNANEKRFESVNEFRNTLKDQQATFISRGELFAWVIAIIGVFFGYSNYAKSREKNSGSVIRSGDKVDVTK